MNAFFTNSQRPVVDCLTVAAGILARSQEVIKGTGADQRFVKNALKICVLPPIYYKYLFLSYFYLIHETLLQIRICNKFRKMLRLIKKHTQGEIQKWKKDGTFTIRINN